MHNAFAVDSRICRQSSCCRKARGVEQNAHVCAGDKRCGARFGACAHNGLRYYNRIGGAAREGAYRRLRSDKDENPIGAIIMLTLYVIM